MYLSKSKFRIGDRDGGYQALEKAVELCEKLFTLADNEELKCTHPSFDLLTVSNTTCIAGEGYSLRSQYINFYDALAVNEGQWEWFHPYMNEERFRALFERVKNVAPIGLIDG